MKLSRIAIAGLALLVLIAVILLVQQCTPRKADHATAGGPDQVPRDPNLVPLRLAERDPFYLMLHVARVKGDDPASLAALEQTLERIEPGGARGQVRVGFVLGVSLYRLLEEDGDGWRVNTADLAAQLDFAASIARPVVVYIKGNHFAHDSPMLQTLSRDQRNFMAFQDGEVPRETYFSSSLNAASLTTDATVELVARRRQALRELGRLLAQFHTRHPELIRGVLLNGETHHLFENFYAGTGAVTNVRFTDYSDLSIAGFAAYLSARGSSLHAADIRALEYDQYAAGRVKVEGWVDARRSAPLGSAEDRFPRYEVGIYVNGERAGSALSGLNRLDVYQALDDSANPNVGFSYLWDFRTAAAARYCIQAVLEAGGESFEIGRSVVTVATDADEPAGSACSRAAAFPALAGSAFRGHLDAPAAGAVARYHPLQEAWLDYRAQQVVDQVNFVGDELRDAGLPAALMYTHQLPPWLNGRWNADLFGVGREFFRQVRYKPGVTLYGGNTLSPAIFDYLPSAQTYAVPEWHPQLRRSPLAPLASLKLHYDSGASFVSPYYFEMSANWRYYEQLADSTPDDGGHARMLMTPSNARMGSNYAFAAIERFAAF